MSAISFTSGSIYPLSDEVAGQGAFVVVDDIVVNVIGTTIIIEREFVTDGASIPRWARIGIDPWGRQGLPAVFHDWLLKNSDFSKCEVDALFLLALQSAKVPQLRANLMYAAVRLAKDDDRHD